MAIDFPNSPSVNDTHTVGSTTWVYTATGWEIQRTQINSTYIVSDTAPSSPTSGIVWYNSTNGKTYIWYDSFWVENAGATSVSVASHASSHIRGGSDIIDGDRLTIDYVPTNYTRSSAATYAGDNTDLTANLAGIDNALPTKLSLTGGTMSGVLNMTANIVPTSNATYNLGSTTYRWANIYTSDLNLSNGIGDYTVIEGEEDLFLVNNRNGKSFKFALIEVDSSEVPPRMGD